MSEGIKVEVTEVENLQEVTFEELLDLVPESEE